MADSNPLGSIVGRRGHFVLESGYHGDLWLDLPLLCLQPEQVEHAATDLARQLSHFDVEVVCGPLNEGAFVALMVALRLHAEFVYSQRQEAATGDRRSVRYHVPAVVRRRLQGKRTAIVDDAINAGSAVRSTYDDLLACGARPVALSALLVLGDAAARFAREEKLPLICLEQRANQVWTPSECPLCAAGIPFSDP